MQVILVDSESARSLGIGRHMQLDVRVGDERLREVDPRGISVNGERILTLGLTVPLASSHSGPYSSFHHSRR
jgi:hypothetical protein